MQKRERTIAEAILRYSRRDGTKCMNGAVSVRSAHIEGKQTMEQNAGLINIDHMDVLFWWLLFY